jgi:beta-glucosidase
MAGNVRGEDPTRPLSIRPEIQTAEWATAWWMPRHEEKLREKEKLSDCQLVWIGDSITHGWEGEGNAIWEARYAKYQPLNLGFSGDRTEQVLWRLEHGEVDGLKPKLAVMMIGTNNAGHRQEPSAETARGIEAIVEQLRKRLPDTKLLLLGIFPRGESPNDAMRKLNDETNTLISKIADGKQVVYLDIGKKFLDEKGNLPTDIMPDKLHPNRRGYEIWADAIDATLAQMLK